MCYIKCLENCDFLLIYFMILLGFCIMKFNVVVEFMFVSWLEFVNLYFFVFKDQVEGYYEFFMELEKWLSDIIGFVVCFLQFNFGV